MLKKLLFQLGLAFVLIVFVFTVFSFAADPVILEWAAGGIGGGWYTMASGIAELIKGEFPEINIKVVPGDGNSNTQRVSNGDVGIGFGTPPFDLMAYKGVEIFKDFAPAKDMRSIGGSFSDNCIHIIVNKDLKANTLEEMIKAKMPVRIVLQAGGTADEVSFRKMLEYYGYTYNDLEAWGGKILFAGYAQQIDMFKDGHIDVAVVNIAPPAAMVEQMSIGRDIKLLSCSEGLIEYMAKEYAYSSGNKAVIHQSSYPKILDKDIITTGMCTEIIVNKDIPEEVVYKITKVLCEKAGDLLFIHPSMKAWIPEEGWKWVAVPLHPGAERYYREVGYLK